MTKGWVKVHRSILDDPIAKSPFVFRVWLECLLRATHKAVDIEYGGKNITLKPGEFVFGRNEWARRLNIAPSTVGKGTGRLTKRGHLRKQLGEQGLPTIYKIVNWEKHQQGNNLGNNLGNNPLGCSLYTNKNVKKARKKEKYIKRKIDSKVSSEPRPPEPTQQETTEPTWEQINKMEIDPETTKAGLSDLRKKLETLGGRKPRSSKAITKE